MASTSSGAFLRLKIGDPTPWNVANAMSYPKGSLMTYHVGDTTLLTASGSIAGTTGTHQDNGNAHFAGIVARDKIANDGITNIALWRSGWFDMPVSGACGPIKSGNLVYVLPDNFVGSGTKATGVNGKGGSGVAIGIALHDSSGGSVLVDVRPMVAIDKVGQ